MSLYRLILFSLRPPCKSNVPLVLRQKLDENRSLLMMQISPHLPTYTCGFVQTSMQDCDWHSKWAHRALKRVTRRAESPLGLAKVVSRIRVLLLVEMVCYHVAFYLLLFSYIVDHFDSMSLLSHSQQQIVKL